MVGPAHLGGPFLKGVLMFILLISLRLTSAPLRSSLPPQRQSLASSRHLAPASASANPTLLRAPPLLVPRSVKKRTSSPSPSLYFLES